MFSWNFAKKLFDGFTILRWTDFMRPTEFVQMEKSASQAILSYIIGKEYEERTGNSLNWRFIVESNIYSLLCKIATSDIKSTINGKIKKDHLAELTNYIIGFYFEENGTCKYGNLIDKKKLEKYIIGDDKEKIESEICYVAHKFASYREFCHLKIFNPLSPDKTRVENEISPAQLKTQISDGCVRDILENLSDDSDNLCLFYSYFEKLKPQVRWSQTCRLPQTTVLGHSMYVAVLTYFVIMELGVQNDADKVLVDSFFAALFHDLPESLTRDIISPVKRNIEKLEVKLAEYEYEEVTQKMTSKIYRKSWKKDFLYLLGKTSQKGKKFNPFTDRASVLGNLIESLDKTAAFVEAKMSVELGVNSEELQKGLKYSVLAIKDKVYSYKDKGDWRQSANTLNFNDFLASIPQYQQGVN